MMSDIVFFELTPANIYDKVIQKNISIVNTGTASTALALTVGADCLFSRNCVSGGDFQAQPLSVSGSHSNSTAVDGLKKSSSSTSITKGNTNTHSVTDIFTLSEVELKNFQSESNRSVLLTWCPSNAEVTAGILTSKQLRVICYMYQCLHIFYLAKHLSSKNSSITALSILGKSHARLALLRIRAQTQSATLRSWKMI